MVETEDAVLERPQWEVEGPTSGGAGDRQEGILQKDTDNREEG